MAEHYRTAGVPFLRSLNIKPFRLSFDDIRYIDEDFHHKIKKSALRPGDVAIVRTGYPGTACVIPDSLPISNCSDLVIVRPNQLLNPNYLASVFNSQFGRDLVGGNLVGAAQQHFNVTVAKQLKLLIPPRVVQDKIAAILSAYDDLIANNQRRIALLERMAEEIYREWFVRLRFPGHGQHKVENGIPQGWRRVPLGDVCALVKRGIAPNYTDTADTLVLNQRCIRNGSVVFAEARGHDTKVPAEKFVRYGDVLINSTGVGTLGRVAVFDHELTNSTCDTHVTICRVRAEATNAYFLGHTLRSLQGYFENMAAGSTGQSELGRDTISRTKIVVPSMEAQTAFARAAEPLWRKKRLLQRRNQILATTRNALLPRLISGKLSVDKLDIRVPPNMAESG